MDDYTDRLRKLALGDEVLVLAVVGLTGVPRAVAAAPKLALALGYDVEAALEGLDP
jgi:hypothetical protein